MVREARQGREEAHRIRSEAFLIKKCAGMCLMYSRVSASPTSKSTCFISYRVSAYPSSKRVQARAKFIPGFLFLPHQKRRRHVLNLFQGLFLSLVKKGVGMCKILFQGFCSLESKRAQARAKFIPGFLLSLIKRAQTRA